MHAVTFTYDYLYFAKIAAQYKHKELKETTKGKYTQTLDYNT